MHASMPKIVLLPGLDGTGCLFKGFIEALPSQFRTQNVVYPREEFLSYAELLSLIVPSEEAFVLVAESFSTPLAIKFAAANPPHLKALVLCAGFASRPIRSCLGLVSSLLVPPLVQWLVQWLVPTLVPGLAPGLLRASLPSVVARCFMVGWHASGELVAEVQDAVSRVAPSVLAARIRAVLGCDARSELAQITVPILYLQATRDRLVSATCLDEIQRIKPQVSAIAIPGPHLILQREPQKAAQIVAKYLQALS